MDYIVFLPFVFFLIVLLATIPDYLREQKERKLFLKYYHQYGGQSYVSKRLWTSKEETWEERQVKNEEARRLANYKLQETKNLAA